MSPRLCSLAVLALALPALAQTAKPAPLDQKALLAATRHAYYLPLDRGVQGFTCSVALDWPLILERAIGKPISSRDATLTQLQAAQVTVTDDILKNATVTATFPTLKQEPLPGSPARSKQDILDHIIQAALSGWNPFLSDRILPVEGNRYHFETSPTGYRLTLDGGSFFSILDLDPQYRITHGETHLNGTLTTFNPAFDPSTHGWLLTALETTNDAGNGSAPDKASFTYTYQFIGDMLIPKRVVVQVGDGPPTPFELQGCTLNRAGVTAESKAAPDRNPAPPKP